MQVDLGTSNVIYTGSVTKIYKGNVLQDQFVNIVRGDVFGDGIIDSLDLLRIRHHLIGRNTLEGAYLLAADVYEDSMIDSIDLLRLQHHLIGKNPIT